MKKIDYTKLVDAINKYGRERFYKLSGVDKMMFYRIKHGSDISLKNLDRCCRVLKKDISQLIEVYDDQTL